MDNIKTSIIEVWFDQTFNEWVVNFSGLREIGFNQFQVVTQNSVFTNTKVEALEVARNHKKSDKSIELQVVDRTTQKRRVIA